MNNKSKFYQRLNNIQAQSSQYSVARLFIDMRDLVDEAEQYNRKEHEAVCAELEEAHKEIEDLKQSLWNANYHHASFRGATYDEAKDYADKLERG